MEGYQMARGNFKGPNNYHILPGGVVVLTLTQGQFTTLSIGDWLHPDIRGHRWYAQWNSDIKGFYCTRNDSSTSKRRKLLLHREILKAKPGQQVDHIRPAETLDNSRSNLRLATGTQQQAHTRERSGMTSRFKGVS